MMQEVNHPHPRSTRNEDDSLRTILRLKKANLQAILAGIFQIDIGAWIIPGLDIDHSVPVPVRSMIHDDFDKNIAGINRD
jgi:hypothetical protein